MWTWMAASVGKDRSWMMMALTLSKEHSFQQCIMSKRVIYLVPMINYNSFKVLPMIPSISSCQDFFDSDSLPILKNMKIPAPAARAAADKFLHSAAENIFPSYRKLANEQSAAAMKNRARQQKIFENIPVLISSHLPLQILLSCTVWLYPFWVLSTLNTLIVKVSSHSRSSIPYIDQHIRPLGLSPVYAALDLARIRRA